MEDLSAFNKGAGGEIQITDTLANLIGKLPLHGYKFQANAMIAAIAWVFLQPISLLRCHKPAGGQSGLGENLGPVLRDIMGTYLAPA